MELPIERIILSQGRGPKGRERGGVIGEKVASSPLPTSYVVRWRAVISASGVRANVVVVVIIVIIFLTPVLNSQGMKKLGPTLCNTKKYKNQGGMNLTPPPPPSQNSHAVR